LSTVAASSRPTPCCTNHTCCVAACCSELQEPYVGTPLLQQCQLCCSVMQSVSECYSILQCVAVCCSVLQCVAACCSVLQCVAVCCRIRDIYTYSSVARGEGGGGCRRCGAYSSAPCRRPLAPQIALLHIYVHVYVHVSTLYLGSCISVSAASLMDTQMQAPH